MLRLTSSSARGLAELVIRQFEVGAQATRHAPGSAVRTVAASSANCIADRSTAATAENQQAANVDAFESSHRQPEGSDTRTPAPSDASSSAQHWLDRHFPGTREWLENQNRKWWIKGLQARCRQRLELQGREQYLGQLIEHAYQEQLAQHADKVTDERSQTHLQVACLVLATAKVLRPWIRNDEELMSIISAHMGNQTSPLLRFLLRFTLYLYPDAYASTVNRLRMLQMDYGSGFESRLEKGPDASELTVTSCFYQRLFEEQDLGRLAACCCCSQDAVWFRQLEKHGVGFQRTQWLGDGDRACRLRVTRLAKEQ